MSVSLSVFARLSYDVLQIRECHPASSTYLPTVFPPLLRTIRRAIALDTARGAPFNPSCTGPLALGHVSPECMLERAPPTTTFFYSLPCRELGKVHRPRSPTTQRCTRPSISPIASHPRVWSCVRRLAAPTRPALPPLPPPRRSRRFDWQQRSWLPPPAAMQTRAPRRRRWPHRPRRSRGRNTPTRTTCRRSSR